MILRMVGVAAAASAVALGARAATSDGSIATFTHDLGGSATLRAYPPEPAAVTGEGERIANRLYGFIDTRSPKTPYFCSWRDTGPLPARKRAAGPPAAIQLACGFGTEPWSPPPGLIAYAEQALRRDEARLRIGWTRRGGVYVMDTFEVRVRNGAAGRDFRSVWSGSEVAKVAMSDVRFTFPSAPTDRLTFSISAKVPRRHNIGEAATAPIARITVTGTAPPQPDWVLY